MNRLRAIQEKREIEGLVDLKISKVKGINVTHLSDDKYLFCNKEVTFVGNFPEFYLYVRTNLSYVNVRKESKNRRFTTVRRLVLSPPRSIEHESELKQVLNQAMVECDTAIPVKVTRGFDPIMTIPDTVYKQPVMDTGILTCLLLVDAEFTASVGHPFSPLCLGNIKGYPVTNVRGISQSGITAAIGKLFQLRRDKVDMSHRITHTLDKYFYELDRKFSPGKVPFSIPTRQQVFDYESTNHASAGYCELEREQDSAMLGKIRDLKSEFFSITTSLQPKKNQAASINVMRIFDVLKLVEEALQEGRVPDDGAFGLSRLVIKRKWEVGNLCDFHNYLDGLEGIDENGKKFLDKLRLFWSDSQFKVLIDRIIMTPGLDLIKGGVGMTQICAIGCSVTNGTYSNLIRRLNLDLEFVEPQLAQILRVIYSHFPSLIKRAFSELDFSKYDSLIQAVLILLCTAFMNMFPYQDYPGDSLIEKMIYYLNSVSATNNAYKYAYIPFLGVLFYFSGRVPSGSLSTSVLDSLAQIILRCLFMDMTIESLKKEGKYELAFKCFLTRYYLLVALIYGDDRTEGIPEEVYQYIGLHAFKDWLTIYFGWQVKIIIPDIENGQTLDFFPDAVGKVFFESRDDGFIVEVDLVESPSFLKTTLKEVYLDGEFKTILPHRKTEDLLCKMANSLSALSHPIKYLCALTSLAHLASGNLEVFAIVRKMYTQYSKYLGLSPILIESYMEDLQTKMKENPVLMRGIPNSMRRVLLEGTCGEFPKWSTLVYRHNINYVLEKKAPRTFEYEILGTKGMVLDCQQIPLEEMVSSWNFTVPDEEIMTWFD